MMNKRVSKRTLSALLGLTIVFAVAAPAGASHFATTSGTCALSSSEQRGGLGATYVTYLSVKHTSCATGKRVVKKFHRCRRAAGGVKGYCRSRIEGFKCSEKRNAIKTQFSSTTTCTAGSKRIVFKYTQYT